MTFTEGKVVGVRLHVCDLKISFYQPDAWDFEMYVSRRPCVYCEFQALRIVSRENDDSTASSPTPSRSVQGSVDPDPDPLIR